MLKAVHRKVANNDTGENSIQGVTKKCRLSWPTTSTLVYEPKCGGGGLGCEVSANEYSTWSPNIGH